MGKVRHLVEEKNMADASATLKVITFYHSRKRLAVGGQTINMLLVVFINGNLELAERWFPEETEISLLAFDCHTSPLGCS